MKRRLILLVVSFLVLASLVGVYQLAFIGSPGDDNITGPMPDLPTLTATTGPADGNVGIGPGQKLRVESRKDGRLDSIFEADSWQKDQQRGCYDLVNPRYLLYQSDGQEIVITAQRGVVFAEELTSGIHASRGALSGDVRILIDRGTEQRRTPLEQRPADKVVISADDLQYNNDLLRITTAGPVTVRSQQADIDGKGLLLEWNDAPRQLRQLRLEQGQRMVIRQSSDGEGLLPMPGKAASTGPVEPAASLTASTATAAAADKDKQNVYAASFAGDIKVVSGPASLYDAQSLTVTFEWDRDESQAQTQTAGASGPGPDAHDGTGPAATLADDELIETVVTWSGPLVLKPVGYVQTVTDSYRLDAQGQNMVLVGEDKEELRCRELTYLHPQQTGRALGTAAKPATLSLPSGEVIAFETLRFYRQTGLAHIEGPGMMSSPSDAQGDSTAGEASSKPAAVDRITWRDSVVVGFDTVPKSDGGTTLHVKRALFRGQVRLDQGATGDSLACDELDVAMTTGADGKPMISKALAAGNVSGVQQGSRIAADKATVEFAPGKPDAAGRRRPEPTTLLAQGNVKITDDSDKSQPPVVATCDRLDADIIASTAVMHAGTGETADDAKVVQGVNSLQGRQIAFKSDDGSVFVDGRGQITYLTDRDINGRELQKPRQMTVTWSRSMDYNNKLGLANFNGNAHAFSGSDDVRSQTMHLYFDREAAKEPAKDTAPAKDKTDKAPGRGLAKLADYSDQQLKMVIADGDVVIASSTLDDQGRLLQRLQLKAPKATYDHLAQRMDAEGKGNMLFEDYRPPEKAQEGQADAVDSQRIERPNQTLFEWDKRMQMDQARRSVFLDGNVSMVHRSGKQLAGVDKLNVPPWPELGEGKKTAVACEKLVAQFAEADKTQAEKTDDKATGLLESGPRLGALTMVSATGWADRMVTLEDGQWQVVGKRLLFDRDQDIAVVWGFLEGDRPADARVLQRVSFNRARTWTFPKVTWYRTTNRVVGEKVGSGG